MEKVGKMKDVEVRWKGEKLHGRIIDENKERLILKLDNGYNIGIKKEEIEEMKITEEHTEEKEKKLKTAEKNKAISIVGCGGTISSKVEYKTGAVYPILKPKEIIEMFPEIKEIGEIRMTSLFSILSEDMTPKHWVKIAKKIEEEIKNGAEGIVLLHGTDTMHYTSAALSFMIKETPFPIVLTGAQRSSDRPSSDNKLNLLNSMYVVKNSDLGEISVVMHSSINDDFAYVHRGTRVRKMHTSRRDAFKSIDIEPLMKVDYRKKKIDIINKYKKTGKKIVIDTKINENVGMVYIYPGIKKEVIRAFRNHDGLVLVGTGLGHAPTNPFGNELANSVFEEIKELIESGIPVVMSSQTIYGRINMEVYTTGRMLREIGVIGHLADWTPEAAYAKLSWVLGHEKDMKKIKEMMEKNIAGEITERSVLI